MHGDNDRKLQRMRTLCPWPAMLSLSVKTIFTARPLQSSPPLPSLLELIAGRHYAPNGGLLARLPAHRLSASLRPLFPHVARPRGARGHCADAGVLAAWLLCWLSKCDTLTSLQAAVPDETDLTAPLIPSPTSATPTKPTAASRAESCPPASPAFTEQITAARDEVIYLIGGYARYDRP